MSKRALITGQDGSCLAELLLSRVTRCAVRSVALQVSTGHASTTRTSIPMRRPLVSEVGETRRSGQPSIANDQT